MYRLNRTERNLASINIGAAIKIAQSLGLHVNESLWKEQSPIHMESKKRIWWSLFSLETSLGTCFGMPLAIDESLCNVSPPSEVVRQSFLFSTFFEFLILLPL